MLAQDPSPQASRGRKKKLPEKHTSQGGKGRHTFPGAIGRNDACVRADDIECVGLDRQGSVSERQLGFRANAVRNEDQPISKSTQSVNPTTWLPRFVLSELAAKRFCDAF